MADLPIVLVQLQGDEFFILELGQVEVFLRLGLAVDHFIHAARFAMDDARAVALARVVPIGDIHAAIGSGLQADAAKPSVVGHQKIFAVVADIARAFPLKHVVVQAVAVDVAHEDRVAITVGPVVAQVNQRAGVSVTAAGFAMLPLTAARLVQSPPPQCRWSELGSIRSYRCVSKS